MISWQQFIKDPSNKKLSLTEQKKRYLLENSKQLFDLQAINAMYGGAAGGVGFSGNASDGPLSGATVSSPGTGNAVTDNAGRFTLPGIPTEEITVTGGTDAITGVAFTGELKGFPEYSTVSPLTTLAYHLKEEDTSLTADTAVDLLFASSSTLFGIDLDITDKDVMLNKDYVAESILADNQAAVAAQSIATYLESVTEMVGSAVKGADSTNFTTNSAKVEGYRSIARQIQGTSGAKTEINTTNLFDAIKLPNGNAWTGGLTGSLNKTNRDAISTQLTNVKTQLGTLSRSEAFSANYLTTQIQAINRGVKEDYAVDADKLAKGQEVEFDSLDAMIGKSSGSLAQIEDGKANENTRAEGGKSETFYTFGGMTFTQTIVSEKGSTVVTLFAPFDPAFFSFKAIAAASNAFTAKDGLKKYVLDSNSEAVSFAKFGQYNPGIDIVAKQTMVSSENESANKLFQLTLDGLSLQMKTVELVDGPVAEHIFGTGTYTMSMEGSRTTQVLQINVGSRGFPNSLSFGGILAFGIESNIFVNQNFGMGGAPITYIVRIDNATVASSVTFSGTGNKSTLSFTQNPDTAKQKIFTITYTTR
mgnify:CR=1 FL=1